MDVVVDRNAFGRQVDSFETELNFKGLAEDRPFHAIFIRAPLVRKVGDGVKILAQLNDGGIVAVQEGNWLGTAFHPELTNDHRVHQYFCDMVSDKASV